MFVRTALQDDKMLIKIKLQKLFTKMILYQQILEKQAISRFHLENLEKYSYPFQQDNIPGKPGKNMLIIA